MSQDRTIRPDIALEMTMRDVLGNMEEMVAEYGYRDMGGEFEILGIEPAVQTNPEQPLSHMPHTREILSAEINPFRVTDFRVA
jgi:hypothetical protein